MAWPSIIPFIRYEDASAMLTWLEDAFGFKRHSFHEEGDRVVHAEITYGNGMFMTGSTGEDAEITAKTPNQLGGESTGGMYVIVDDVDAHCAQARAAGAEIIMEPTDQEYGSRDYAARDPEGHVWTFGTYRPT
jgi:uncharacterized glyoxalase superfamily protein PhnB